MNTEKDSWRAAAFGGYNNTGPLPDTGYSISNAINAGSYSSSGNYSYTDTKSNVAGSGYTKIWAAVELYL